MIKSLDRTGTWRTYSLADGLAGVRIEHIAEDNEGYLWFATWDNGVSRFDGDAFQTFTRQDGLCGDRVFAIHKDSRGRLWFGTMSGVCWYDGANFHHLEDDGIAGRSVQFIYEDGEGRIWCGGTNTLGYCEGTAFRDLIPLYLQHYEQPPSPQWTNQCWGITQDTEGHLWFGFDYLIRFDGESFYRYKEEEGFPPDQSNYAVGRDRTGQVWIGRYGQRDGLWCYADGTFHQVRVDLGGNAGDYALLDNVYFTTENAGVGVPSGDPMVDPFQAGEKRLSVGRFYEGGKSDSVEINGENTHLYLYENTVALEASEDRLEGMISDGIVHGGNAWWGFGIHWDSTRDLSAFGTLYISLKSTTFTNIEIGMTGANNDRHIVKASAYGYVNDGMWHTLAIPLADFAGDGLNLSAVSSPFNLTGPGGSAGDVMLLDNVYFTDEGK